MIPIVSTYKTTLAHTEDAGSYSDVSVDIGAAHKDRSIIVAAFWRAATLVQATNFTIGGQPLTKLNTPLNISTSIFPFSGARSPAGTTADFTLSLDGTAVRAAFAVWSCLNVGPFT